MSDPAHLISIQQKQILNIEETTVFIQKLNVKYVVFDNTKNLKTLTEKKCFHKILIKFYMGFLKKVQNLWVAKQDLFH